MLLCSFTAPALLGVAIPNYVGRSTINDLANVIVHEWNQMVFAQSTRVAEIGDVALVWRRFLRHHTSLMNEIGSTSS